VAVGRGRPVVDRRRSSAHGRLRAAGLDYADDDGRDYPGDEGWDDVAGPGEPWGNGVAGAVGPGEDRRADSGRSDVAGLDQLWDIGRSTSGHGQDQAPGADGRQARDMGRGDTTGPGTLGDTGTGGMLGADDSATAPPSDLGRGGARDTVAATGASAPREISPSQARDTGSGRGNGSARDGGPARETGAWENGHGRENGSAWEASAWDDRPAREAGSGRDTSQGPARDSGRDLPGGFGRDPLGAPGGRETADFLAAPPPSSSILTTAPHKESKAARPANVGSQTIAAELAGWAAGELPGRPSAVSPGTAKPTAPTWARRAWPPSESARHPAHAPATGRTSRGRAIAGAWTVAGEADNLIRAHRCGRRP
jgi:hypothetical protein